MIIIIMVSNQLQHTDQKLQSQNKEMFIGTYLTIATNHCYQNNEQKTNPGKNYDKIHFDLDVSLITV